MVDSIMYSHIQGYRVDWYRTKAAVERNDATDATPEEAHLRHHLQTRQWVQRLRPLDTVEDAYQQIWHRRQIGPYTGLAEAHDGLKLPGFDVEEFDPLNLQTLTEIGTAAEEITVDAMGLPEQPPVDVKPWTPDPAKRIEEITKLRESIPHDL